MADLPVARPTAPLERIALLDALRGFALFGICIANLLTGFSLWGEKGAPDPATLSTAATDPAAEFLAVMLVDGKFYSIFSLLFGLGFSLQLGRAETRGDGDLRVYRRRLWVLLGLGLIHLFAWPGDIVTFYAAVGFLLLLFRRMTDRKLLGWAAGLLLAPFVLYLPYWLSGGMLNLGLPFFMVANAGLVRLGVPLGLYDLLMTTDWAVLIRGHLVGPLYRIGDLLFQWRTCKVLAMFLLGLYVGRHTLHTRLDEAAPILRRVAAWGFGIGLPASLGMAWLHGAAYYMGTTVGVAYVALYTLGVAPLALGYAAAFALLWRRETGRRVLGVFAPAGRMALTNYLMQTVIGIGLFYGVGLGLGGRVGPTLLWGLAVLILAGQIVFSTVWLRRFRFGPAEWLWRSLTYGQPQPMRDPSPGLTGAPVA